MSAEMPQQVFNGQADSLQSCKVDRAKVYLQVVQGQSGNFHALHAGQPARSGELLQLCQILHAEAGLLG